VGGFIVIVVAIATAVGGDDAAGADRAYLSRMNGLAQDSQTVGAELATLLSRPALTPTSLTSTLRQLLQRQTHDTTQASAISPAPRLRSEHAQALDALQLRVSGLSGLLAAFLRAESSSARPRRSSRSKPLGSSQAT
jgi:hypothetical protein